jgi:trigger factor
MQVSVETTSTIGRRLTIQIPAETLQNEMQERMKALSKTAKVPGFRPGKVPKQLLDQKYGAQVKQEAISRVIELSLPEALEKNDLKPAGNPVVEKVTNKSDQSLQYEVIFDIFPEFTLPEFSKINIDHYQVEITDKDIDNAIEKIRHQFSTWTVVDRPAKLGDKLTIDYSSTMNGKPYENNSSQNVAIELGSGLFIAGFEQALINATTGSEHTLDLKFPEEWRIEKLAGKPVQFKVKVKVISERCLAPLDENFAKKIGAPGRDLEAIRDKVNSTLEKQLAQSLAERHKDQILNALLTQTEVILPKSLVEREMQLIHEDLHRKVGDKAHDTCQHEGLEEQAEKRVALSLILRKIVQQENLVVDKDRVKSKISGIAKSYGNAEQMESMYYESEELLFSVQNSVIVEQTVEFLMTKVNLVPKQVTIEDLFKRAK